MKTILMMTFAIAVMMFAFNTDPVIADSRAPSFIENEQQIDDVEQTAWYEPDCSWKWRLDPNTGNWGWVCVYYNQDEVPGDNVAWDTEPGEDAYCWETVGKNGPVMVCAPDDFWNSENGEKELARGEQPSIKSRSKGNNDSTSERTRSANYMDYCKRSGNCMMFEDSDGDGKFEVAGKYHDGNSLDNDSQESRVAYGCQIQSDGSMHCPGDAWNSENNDSQVAGFGDTYCENNPDGYLCDSLWNEDAESNDGFGGNDVADSGNEGPTSAAQGSDY